MSDLASVASDAATRLNPYVGPRPFREDELFFGRENEATALVNTLLSGRVVLLHSPSGAGKTSLIQASIVPAFAVRNFQICAATKPRFSALRVNLPPPRDADVPNRYVFSIVNGLVGHLVERADALTMTIADALRMFATSGTARYQLLVLDQLEEVLTLDPGDLGGQAEFFRQLGEALDDEYRWGLLAMREDYMGGLDRFQRYVPGHLRSTFRLDFLDERAALRAVQEPPRRRDVVFEDDAARMLVTDLRQVRSDGSEAVDSGPVRSPYVEPVLLQVVCDGLWRRLSRKQGEAFTTITAGDVAGFRPFNRTLSKYFRSVVRQAAAGDRATERALRDWIEEHLITKQSTRRPTRSRPQIDDPEAALQEMQTRYLIRDDPRPGGSWWELSHDRLIWPIIEDNRTWRVANLAPWQVAADDWQRSGHDSSYLLRGSAYRNARAQNKKAEPTAVETSFLEESRKATAADSARVRLEARVNFLQVAVVCSLIVNVALLLMLVLRP